MLHNLTYKGMKRETKEDIQVWTAVGMLIAGVGLSVAGFLVIPLGIIHDSVLWFFAQCLLYGGAVFGIPLYVKSKISSIIGNDNKVEKRDDKQQQ